MGIRRVRMRGEGEVAGKEEDESHLTHGKAWDRQRRI
jgi:hypothetical protein